MESIFTPLWLIIAIILGVYFIFRHKKKLHGFPGPKGLPIVGNAFQLQKQFKDGKLVFVPHEVIRKWAEKYGDLMKVNIFGKDILIVNSLEGITEMLLRRSEDFAGRAHYFRNRCLCRNTEDVIFSDISPEWSRMKKVAMTSLKQFGDQLTMLEDLVTDKITVFLGKLESYHGTTVDLFEDITDVIGQITFTLLYGRTLSDDEFKLFKRNNKMLGEVSSATADNVGLDHFLILRGPWYSKYRTLQEVAKRTMTIYTKLVQAAISNYKDGEINCSMDNFIREMKLEEQQNSKNIFTKEQIRSLALGLNSAAMNTTTHTFYYFVLLMATHPQIQSEAHDEIIKAIGHRWPCIKDRVTIPYMESMLFEVLRLMSTAPLALPHKTMKDTTLLGHQIPAGVEVWPNLWYIHHDERHWEDPWKFKPRRFLDEHGKLVLADHQLRRQLYVFGAGRRVCAGEMLARNRLFLLMTSVIQKFKFSQPDGVTLDADARNLYVHNIVRPYDYNVKVHMWQEFEG